MIFTVHEEVALVSSSSKSRLLFYFSTRNNNDCRRKLDTAGPKHLLEINHASVSADFQDTGNQMNAVREIRIKNANRLIIVH